MSAAQSATVINDDQVRVTTWTFNHARDATGPHVHEHDYIVVPISGGTFTVTSADGATHEMTQHAGVPYRGSASTAHNVAITGATAVFVEIELKRPRPPQ